MGNALSTTLPDDWATIDMVNRFTFCPRLFHLMYVEGRWAENLHTLEGKTAHRRVDRIDQLLPEADNSDEAEPEPEADGDEPPEVARSVSLGSNTLGLMGKLDLVATDPAAREAAPVETKKGRVPNVPERSYPPERAQLMAQALLLRCEPTIPPHEPATPRIIPPAPAIVFAVTSMPATTSNSSSRCCFFKRICDLYLLCDLRFLRASVAGKCAPHPGGYRSKPGGAPDF